MYLSHQACSICLDINYTISRDLSRLLGSCVRNGQNIVTAPGSSFTGHLPDPCFINQGILSWWWSVWWPGGCVRVVGGVGSVEEGCLDFDLSFTV